MEGSNNNDQTILSSLCKISGFEVTRIESVSAGGSGRRYYRIFLSDDTSIIGTCGEGIDENRAFVYLTGHMRSHNLPVPEVLGTNDDCSAYIQTDVGDKTLYDLIKSGRHNGIWEGIPIDSLKKVIVSLPSMQFKTMQGLDSGQCLSQVRMDRRSILRDLNYFKYCFLKPLNISIDEDRLDDAFDRIIEMTFNDNNVVPEAFILRDCQSRNVVFDKNGKLHWIDYQGGRKGPVTYDLASMLWQTRANIPDDIRIEMADIYFDELKKYAPEFKREDFKRSLNNMVILRMIQVLGAYGLRGLIEGKVQFIESIPSTLSRLTALLETLSDDKTEYLKYVIHLASMHRWCRKSEGNKHLVLEVCSFSYKRGMPIYRSEHGGGFVFDCRAPHNPGRYEPYKYHTGLDEDVKRFLDDDGEMPKLVNSALEMVSAAVARYLERGFNSLSVAFGCTGGRHRSVYGAEKLAKLINEKYGIEVRVDHTNIGVSKILSAKS